MHYRLHNRLGHWHRRAIYSLTGLLVVSGLAWLAVSYLLVAPDEPVPGPHPLAGLLLEIHGITAYTAVAIYGLVGHAHIRTGWRAPPMRTLGLWLCVTIVLLVVTGLGFYYVASENAVPVLRWIHLAVGMLLPCVLAAHIVRGRRLA